MTIIDGAAPGPTAMISALIHGNEICGAFALERMLSENFTVDRGRLILAFANTAAFFQFDSSRPYASRFIDEDMNRVWSADVLDGPRNTVELARARELGPYAEAADYLLDLHSTSLPTPPMLLCGTPKKGRAFAASMGYPSYVVADAGHSAGVRLRDFAAFGDPASARVGMLVECGQHFEENSPAVALNAVLAFLRAARMIDGAPPGFPTPPEPSDQKLIEVTHTITIRSDRFVFDREYRCFETIAQAGTLIARDGTREIVAPYDDCVLVMPARQPVRSQTAVRLGRYVTDRAV